MSKPLVFMRLLTQTLGEVHIPHLASLVAAPLPFLRRPADTFLRLFSSFPPFALPIQGRHHCLFSSSTASYRRTLAFLNHRLAYKKGSGMGFLRSEHSASWDGLLGRKRDVEGWKPQDPPSGQMPRPERLRR